MKLLRDLWDEATLRALNSDPVELLRYRSNLLGADLRLTNFGGGNTSSKLLKPDPFTGKLTKVLAVKGSGGDLGSIQAGGFALLYLDRLNQLQAIYKGQEYEDEMVALYPLCAFGPSKVATSIDTPLHAFLPFDHVDHLHPDWAISLAASANAMQKLAEFNSRFKHRLLWLPWHRPGFELGLLLKKAVEENPDCDGILLGSHGLFTWGNTPRESYVNTLTMIDDLGQFVLEHTERAGSKLFGGERYPAAEEPAEIAAAIFPFLRGSLAGKRRRIGHYDGSAEMLGFVNALDGKELARLGTSCPDHFIRTRIRPMYVDWHAGNESVEQLKGKITLAVEQYRQEYVEYYRSCAAPDSPALRDPNPSVVLVSGLGMFTFGKSKKEARTTAEFYVNAKQVMAGATALGIDSEAVQHVPQAKRIEESRQFMSYKNYVALPPKEAFRIEYWSLEEAKLQRMPAEKEFGGKIFFVAGGGSGIGRATVLELAARGAHLMIADRSEEAAEETAQKARELSPTDAIEVSKLRLQDRQSIAAALAQTVMRFGGIDGVVNATAEPIPTESGGASPEERWKFTFDVNITGNFLLADEAGKILKDQGLTAAVVLTSSANAVVPKTGSEAFDVSKGALNHLIRELAIGMAPLVRVNGIAPGTITEDSSSSPALLPSEHNLQIEGNGVESTPMLRTTPEDFRTERTLLNKPVTPEDCAKAICWLASEQSAKTSGHVIPVDAGLPQAFLR